MAYPVVASIGSGGAGFGSSTYNAAMPSGIAASDLLIAFAYRADSTADWTDPSGWTRKDSASGNSNRSWCWAKIAAGSDTLSIDRSTSSGVISTIIYRITGFTGATVASVEADLIADFSGDWDCPSITASWGNAENLFIAMLGRNDVSVGAFPTGYTGDNLQVWNEGVHGALRVANKQSALATDDPAKAAEGNGSVLHAGTIVVRGSAVGSSYTLTAEQGSYAFSGQDVALTYSGASGTAYTLTAEGGTYLIVGSDSSSGFGMFAESGVYILTGQDTGFTFVGGSVNYTLSAEGGIYLFTGRPAQLLGPGDVASFGPANRYEKLVLMGYSGEVNDMLLKFFLDNGAITRNLNQAEMEFLAAQGALAVPINNRKRQFYTSLGYSGSLSDMEYQYWYNL